MAELNLTNTIAHMDIFDLCDCIEDNSIDMILADLPYQITNCFWDVMIPFDPMWECFKRVIKPRGAIVLTASGRFTYQLAMSNFEWFKYEWVWDKKQATSPYSASKQPMKAHEMILIFAEETPLYYPIMQQRTKAERQRDSKKAYKTINTNGLYSNEKITISRRNSIYKHPADVVRIAGLVATCKERTGHPTQKPVALFEYLIRTYTQPGETVFDPCVGSGTTAIAARNTGRNYIVGDSSAEYVQVARDRLAQPYTMPMFTEAHTEPKPEQTVMELGE